VANTKHYKVKVTIGDSVVEVEGEERGVVAIVSALSDAVRAGRKSPESIAQAKAPEPLPRSGQIDIRTFFEEKQPSSDVEAAAVAAYFYKYLTSPEDRRETVDATALENAFRLARRPLPARAAFTLVNARNAGYLDSTGETGAYRLNPVGFNLVEHTLKVGERGLERKGSRRKRSPQKKKAIKTRGR
jgi:hypothetical protein